MEVNCPFCGSKSEKTKDLISSLNKKKYSYHICGKCGLKFFYPLVFEDVYQNESYSGYSLFHEGRTEAPMWIKHTYRRIKRLKFDMKKSHVLDIGSGDCLLYKFLSRLGLPPHNYHALDLDKKSLRVCRGRGIKNTHAFYFNRKAIAKIGKKFDMIIATEMLEHQVDPKEFFEAAFMLLKDDGRFLLTVPHNKRFFKNYRKEEPPHHFLLFNKEFFNRNFKKNIVLLEDFCYNENRSLFPSCRFISEKLFGTDALFPLFVPAVLLIRVMDYFIGEGLFIVLKKDKKIK